MKPLNGMFLTKFDFLLKYIKADRMIYLEENHASLWKHVTINYWWYYKELKPHQIMVYSHHFCHWLFFSLFPNSFIVLGVKFQVVANCHLECNPFLNFVVMYLGWWFISRCFMLFVDVFKTLLNIWQGIRIWSIM